MPNLVASTVYAAPTLSVPTTSTGVTHTHMASGVTYTPTTLMSKAPTTVSRNPVGTSALHVKLNMKRFSGDLTKWTTFWDSFSSSIHENPFLSKIDKFNYLISLLESTAAEAIAGLMSTDANYEEAVSVLQQRFGNPQLIINRHMEALLNVPGISSHQGMRGLRKLHDGFLTSVLINKLPPELRLIITCEMTGLT